MQLALAQTIQVDGRDYLFTTDDNGLIELDGLAGAIVGYFKAAPAPTRAGCLEALGREHHAPDLAEALGELEMAGVVRSDVTPLGPIGHAMPPPGALPLKNLVLLVAQDCNMKCTYCYASGGDFGAPATMMTAEVAVQAVDFLLAHSEGHRRVHVQFLGGEPLMNFATIQAAVSHARQRERDGAKPIDFSMTTNGSLLNDKNIDWLCEEHIGVSVSMDGPKEVQDRHRVFNNGVGSYDIIVPKVKRLLERHTTRPIAARVTITKGTDRVVPLFDHLIDMGFFEVGLAPVTSGDNALTYAPEEMARLLDEFRELSDRYVQGAIEGRYVGFSNLSNLITELHEGQIKNYPCGAGAGLLSCGADGRLYLCHRFGEKQEFQFGHVATGADEQGLSEFLEAAHLKNKTACQSCWIKHVCAGGCYHEANDRYGTPFTPNLHYCDYMREWVRIGLETYVRIGRDAPEFLARLTGKRNIT